MAIRNSLMRIDQLPHSTNAVMHADPQPYLTPKILEKVDLTMQKIKILFWGFVFLISLQRMIFQ